MKMCCSKALNGKLNVKLRAEPSVWTPASSSANIPTICVAADLQNTCECGREITQDSIKPNYLYMKLLLHFPD